ncbi:MAG: type III-A CRISPR-associated RAMP protein Csm5 [Firmicutes bacterium]|nr:type III-A CRISPR-associated RAMP protein Csm5 [Bacillota bacterium]
MDNIKRYKIKLTALAPIFIGSGRKINKCEYVFANNKVYVIDPDKLMDVIIKRNLTQRYINFMSRGGENVRLKSWLDSAGIKDYQSIAAYTLTGMRNINDRNGIQAFIKDAYNRPYIPGSSLKGMLRSVILWNEVYSNDGRVKKTARNAAAAARTSDGKHIKKELAKHSDELERMFFTEEIDKTRVSNMRGLSISDSKPFALGDLTLCEKIDISDKGRKKPINIMRECIKPGVIVEFDMTVDERIFKYSLADLRRMIEDYSIDYSNIVTYAFVDNEEEKNALFLGGGAGYFSKTVTYSLFDEDGAVEFARNYLRKTTPRKHKHENDYNISPHMRKCTIYNGETYEMGKCGIEIEPAE